MKRIPRENLAAIKTRTVHVRISEQDYAALEETAKRYGTTEGFIARRLIQRAIAAGIGIDEEERI